MHVLSVREPVEVFNPAGSLLESKLPKPSEPTWESFSFNPKGDLQSISTQRKLSYASYDPVSPGYTDHCYDYFCHSRSSSVSSADGSPPHDILILGATGRIGTYITRAILDAHSQGYFGRICVYTRERTLVERSEDICALESLGVEVFIGSLSDEKKFKEACRGIDTVISCVGRTAIEKQINLISWAEQCSVTRFFPSEFGTDIEYFPNSVNELPHQPKLKVRAHMKTMKRIEHTYLVTGPYSDLYFGAMREKPEAGGFDVKRRKAYLLGDGETPVSFTAMNDVGKFVVAALINFNASRNSTLVVHSFTATPKEIVEAHEAQTGDRWDVKYTKLEALKKLEKQAYQANTTLATVLSLRRIWTQGGTLYKFYDDALLGHVETETLADQVQLNIQKQTGVLRAEESLLSMLSSV